MGVMFHPEAPGSTYASWSYSGFGSMRDRLAVEFITELDGSALGPLLNQPDTEGTITPDQAEAMLPVLRRIVEDWLLNDPHDYDAQHLALVCRSLQHAM